MNDQAIEQEIQAKGKTAPRVTPADIDANIASAHYFTAKDGVIGDLFTSGLIDEPNGHNLPPALPLLTFCVLTLRNGFTVTGESACASPENFDAGIGRKIARDNAVQKIWPLMGYALKQQMHQAANLPPALGAAHVGYSTLQPHQQRVVDEKAALDDKLAKLQQFVDGAIFGTLDEAEQSRLGIQLDAMAAYSEVLEHRIAAFEPANHPV